MQTLAQKFALAQANQNYRPEMRIDRAKAECDRLRATLQEIADYPDRAVIENDAGPTLRGMARAALAESQP